MTREIKLKESLEELIEVRGYSRARKQICQKVGISASALSQYIRGQAKPGLEVLVALAEFFDVSIDYLVFGMDSKPALTLDYGPLATYMDSALSKVQAQNARHAELVARMGEVISKQIAAVAQEIIAHDRSVATGVSTVDEIFALESHSLETWILTTELEYDIIMPPANEDSGTAAAGRFFPVVMHNLTHGRPYRFLLPADIREWHPIADQFRTMLQRHSRNNEQILRNCKIRRTDTPVISGCGFCRLDRNALAKAEPALYEHVRTVISEEGWIGYSMPPSPYLDADLLMDTEHLRHARAAFDKIWSKARRI